MTLRWVCVWVCLKHSHRWASGGLAIRVLVQDDGKWSSEREVNTRVMVTSGDNQGELQRPDSLQRTPCERLLTWEGYLHRGLPRGRGTGLLGWLLWKSVVSDGSRMSLASTQDLTSGPYPSQSKRYCRTPPRRRESRISWTWYASSPSMMRQGGPWLQLLTAGNSEGSPDHGKRGGWNPSTHWKGVSPVDVLRSEFCAYSAQKRYLLQSAWLRWQ